MATVRPKGQGSIDLGPAVDALQANPQVGQVLTAAFTTYLPDGGSKGYKADYDVEATSLKFPGSISLGSAFTPLPGWLLALDLSYINWAGASSRIKIKANKGTNADFNEINGGPGLDYTVLIDWRDQIVVAAGTAVAPTDWLVFRGGLNYGRNPMDEEFLIGNSLGTEAHATLGVGFHLGHWDLDVAYMYGLPKTVGDVRFTRSTSEQHFLYFGVGYRF